MDSAGTSISTKLLIQIKENILLIEAFKEREIRRLLHINEWNNILVIIAKNAVE
jgi:hypothetical protein